MAGDGGKFVCARSSAGESRQSRLAQPMKHAVLWKPGGVAPSPELIRETVRGIALAAIGCQQREVADRCGGNDRRQVGMDGDRERGASLLLTNAQHAVADMLLADAQHVAAALCRVQPERKRKAGLGADRPVRLERRDLIFAPRGKTVRLWHLEADAQGRILAHQLAVKTPPEEMTEGLEPIERGMWWQGVEQRNDKFLRQ
jgi:hypothetical protein